MPSLEFEKIESSAVIFWGAARTACRECKAIGLEYRKASFESWSKSSVKLLDALRFLKGTAEGDENDVVRLEELPRPTSSMVAAINVRRIQYWKLTGHHVNLPEPDHPTMVLDRPAGM
jgi:hypothetical protein